MNRSTLYLNNKEIGSADLLSIRSTKSKMEGKLGRCVIKKEVAQEIFIRGMATAKSQYLPFRLKDSINREVINIWFTHILATYVTDNWIIIDSADFVAEKMI